jgi:cyanophycinase-like exopeptidase
MKINRQILLCILLIPVSGFGQNYTSYFTGNPNDTTTHPHAGVCMMGGATEDDNAMKWFLQRADGGDVLVLRTSGSNGYNSYMYTLGPDVNSVESIVFNDPSASYEPYVLQKIRQAEAIWFAGGDQWTYVTYWRKTPVDSLVNIAIQQRHIVVGGTSAGMAILGKYYFSAQNGTVTSPAALANPYNSKVTVDSTRFIQCAFMGDVITDTHFDDPDRRGRLDVFLSRIFTDYSVYAKGIACDEYTAVCIDTSGIAKVYGGYPADDDNAYFVQSNCKLAVRSPENCTPGNPLTWYLGGEAVKVYRVKGTSSGANTFDLNDWKTGTGGTWLDWSVSSGTFSEQAGTALDCSNIAVQDYPAPDDIIISPNPSSGWFYLSYEKTDLLECTCSVYNPLGQKMAVELNRISSKKMAINTAGLEPGLYFLQITGDGNKPAHHVLIKSEQ